MDKTLLLGEKKAKKGFEMIFHLFSHKILWRSKVNFFTTEFIFMSFLNKACYIMSLYFCILMFILTYTADTILSGTTCYFQMHLEQQLFEWYRAFILWKIRNIYSIANFYLLLSLKTFWMITTKGQGKASTYKTVISTFRESSQSARQK